MKKQLTRGGSLALAGLVLCGLALMAGLVDADEFVGPFQSWGNVKTDYGVMGDGEDATDSAPK